MRLWHYTGEVWPPFADTPAPGQESVWDYPRPPRLEPFAARVRVERAGRQLAETGAALRVLETASPPTVYLPRDAVSMAQLVAVAGASSCEWKGRAAYLAHRDEPALAIAWHYPSPLAPFTQLAGYLSFYPGRVACYVDDERVRPQPGGFYGGWLTAAIAGPVKGEAGTEGW